MSQPNERDSIEDLANDLIGITSNAGGEKDDLDDRITPCKVRARLCPSLGECLKCMVIDIPWKHQYQGRLLSYRGAQGPCSFTKLTCRGVWPDLPTTSYFLPPHISLLAISICFRLRKQENAQSPTSPRMFYLGMTKMMSFPPNRLSHLSVAIVPKHRGKHRGP